MIGPPDRLHDRSDRADRAVRRARRLTGTDLDRAGGRAQAVHARHGAVPCRSRFAALRRDASAARRPSVPIAGSAARWKRSILHAHVNKYHAGFLGHSYVCPWVNLGALTTNSDLKNDYSHVRVPVLGESVDTGLTKIGCFIADHAKTAIGSLLNTGSSIGAMAMILPDGQLSPKHVPSFCKAAHGELTDGIDLERALRTARIAMGRRNCESDRRRRSGCGGGFTCRPARSVKARSFASATAISAAR